MHVDDDLFDKISFCLMRYRSVFETLLGIVTASLILFSYAVLYNV